MRHFLSYCQEAKKAGKIIAAFLEGCELFIKEYQSRKKKHKENVVNNLRN